VNAAGTGYSPDGQFYTEPALQAVNVVFTEVTANSMRIVWTAGDGDGSIVVVKEGAAVDAAPVDGTQHAAGSVLGSGEDLGGGNYVVFRGVGTEVEVTALTPGLTYHVAVYTYAGSSSLINYIQDGPATGSQETAWEVTGHNEAYNINCVDCHSMHAQTLLPRDAVQETFCKTCHNPTGPASDKSDVSNHIVDGGLTIIDCGSCHDLHKEMVPDVDDPHVGGLTRPNLKYIRSNMSLYYPTALEPTVYQKRPKHFAFDDESNPWNGPCQSCHTLTTHHTNDNSAGHDHEIQTNCTGCHKHQNGFIDDGS
jgi:RNase P subunit RPR2